MMPSFIARKITRLARGVKNKGRDGKILATKRRLGRIKSMNCNPVDVALQHVSETKHLLDALITSSESFDYPKAKLVLRALQKKSRELAKVRAELLNESLNTPPNVLALPTIAPARPAT
jgi:hypothetical protein